MTPDIAIKRIGGAPTWPDGPYESVIVIADPASQVERDLVKSWVADNAPDGVTVDVISIPPSRRRKPFHRLDERLAARLERDDNPLIIPLRVVWMPKVRDGRRSLSWKDFLSLRDPRDPDVLSQHAIVRMHPDRVRILAGAGATVGELKAAWSECVETLGYRGFRRKEGPHGVGARGAGRPGCSLQDPEAHPPGDLATR